MILRRGIIAPLAVLVALVTSSVTLFLGVANAPVGFFGDAEYVLVLPPGELVPGQSSIDASLVGPLAQHPSVDRLSAEVYAPTVVQGRSILVRGVSFPDLLALEPDATVDGRIPESAREALVGRDLARALGLETGDAIEIPGSKSNALVPVRVVGLLASTGPARDEILLTLEAARVLVDLPSDRIHVVRIDPADRGAVVELVRGASEPFTYSNVTLSTTDPLAGEMLSLSAQLANWGPTRASATATVRGDDIVLATRTFTLDGRSTQTIEIAFRVPQGGVSNISLNPTFDVRTHEPALRFEHRDPPELGEPFAFRVFRPDGEPAADVRIVAMGATTRTEADGSGTIVPAARGPLQVKALLEDGRTGAILDLFVPAEGAADRPLAQLLGASIRSSDGYVRANETISLTVHAQNIGGAHGSVEIPVLVDDKPAPGVPLTLAPGSDAIATMELPPLPPGKHTIRIGSATYAVVAIEGDPAIEAILARYDAAARGGENDIGEAHSDYVEQVIGNVLTAIVALSIATGALATTAAIAVIARHVGERVPVIGIMKALGASDEQVQERVAREALAYGAAAAAIGIAAGSLVAWAIESMRLLHAFGHQIHPRYPWHVLALVFALATLATMLVARRLVAARLQQPPDALMRGARGSRRAQGAAARE